MSIYERPCPPSSLNATLSPSPFYFFPSLSPVAIQTCRKEALNSNRIRRRGGQNWTANSSQERHKTRQRNRKNVTQLTASHKPSSTAQLVYKWNRKPQRWWKSWERSPSFGWFLVFGFVFLFETRPYCVALPCLWPLLRIMVRPKRQNLGVTVLIPLPDFVNLLSHGWTPGLLVFLCKYFWRGPLGFPPSKRSTVVSPKESFRVCPLLPSEYY